MTGKRQGKLNSHSRATLLSKTWTHTHIHKYILKMTINLFTGQKNKMIITTFYGIDKKYNK